jgi:hypothetical protein
MSQLQNCTGALNYWLGGEIFKSAGLNSKFNCTIPQALASHRNLKDAGTTDCRSA